MNTKTKLRRAQNFARFEEIYKKLEDLYKSEFEQIARRKNKRLWFGFALMLVTLTALTIVLMQSLDGSVNHYFIIAAIMGFGGTLVVMISGSPKEKSFVNDFKQRIIGTLLKELQPNLNYDPVVQDKKEILSNYKTMGFEMSNCGMEYVDDKIEGNIYDNIAIRLSNISIKKQSGKSSNQIFNGLFVELNLNKNMSADVRVLLPTTYYLGNAKDCKKIEMDNSSFEKQFNVYTDNKIITNQILTSEVMEQLKSYYDKFGMTFELVIKDKMAGIRIETGPMFESIALKNILHKEDTFIYYSVLNFTFDLIKDIYNILQNTDI